MTSNCCRPPCAKTRERLMEAARIGRHRGTAAADRAMAATPRSLSLGPPGRGRHRLSAVDLGRFAWARDPGHSL